MLVDSHCHLEWDSFDADRDEVVARAAAAGVGRILTVGTNVASARVALQIAERYANVYAAAGVHPHDAKDADENSYVELAELLRGPKVVALGEIGLDFFKNYSPREAQVAAFRRQLRLARELDLPLIIHDRDAHAETLAILRDEGDAYRGVFHCFAGDEKMAAEVMALGFYVSFTGNITFHEKMKAHRVLRACPLDRVLVETDAPFLTPQPHRGQRNEPAYVRHVAEQAAAVLALPVEELAAQTAANAYALFRFEHAGRRGEIAYEHKGALYLNPTSRCVNGCPFCAKAPGFVLGGHYLYLPRAEEPDAAQLVAAAGDPSRWPEVVFCGFGEPTLRWQTVLETAAELKNRGAKRIRLNTNGLANLIHGRAVAPEMRGKIDAVSVSLNAPDAASYRALCRPSFGDAAFPAVCEFIAQARLVVPEVTATAVNVPGVDLAAVRRLAEETLQVRFRVRG